MLDGLADAASSLGIGLPRLLADTGRMIHATTQSSNAVFAFAGARTAVLATRGFGDTLVIMRAIRRVAGLSVFERHHYRATEKPRLLVALIRGGEWSYSRETVLNQYQLRLPMIDVVRSARVGARSHGWTVHDFG